MANTETPRSLTRPAHVGPVVIGGGAPIVVQSMTCTKTEDTEATAAQVRSLAEARYYAHPQNKFWKIIYGAWGLTPDADFDARYRFILAHGLALWDVVKCAEREGSADGSIRNETPNDIPALLAAHPNIRRIIFNGGFAFAKYKKYFGEPAIDYRKVLSTSPACAGRDREREEMWMEALGRI